MTSTEIASDDPAPATGKEWALRPVAGRAWPWVLGVWSLLFLLALAVEIAGTRMVYERTMLRPFSHVGLGWRQVDGVVTLRPPNTDEGRRAGFRDGQTLVAVDGVNVGNRVADMVQVDKLLVGPEGSTVVLTTRDPDGTIADRRLTRSEENADALYRGSGVTSRGSVWIQLTAQVVPDLFLLFVSAMLMRSRRREPVGILFAFGFLSLLINGPASAPLISDDWQVWTQRLIGFIGLSALSSALLAFPDGRIIGRTRQALLVLALVTAILASLVVRDSEAIGIAALVLCFIGPAIALFLRARRIKTGASRQQLRFALFGFAIAIVTMVLATICSMQTPDDMTTNPGVSTWLWLGGIIFSAIGVIAISGGLLLSLLRYRLYDVDAVISRSAAYGLMTVGFVAAFAGLENILEQAAQTYFAGNAGKAAGAISAALAAGLIGPMHNRIHRWTENRFRKGLVAMRRDLPNTIDDLRETATFDELAAAVEPAVARGVSAEWVRLRPPQFLDAADIDVRGELERPIATNDGRALSLLEVGPRPDGSPHGKDEREAVDALVEPLARALTVIERREAKEQALDRRIGALEAAIRALKGKKTAAST